MYEQHFNLTDRPFSIAPDPRFLYMSARHREALAHLLYGLGEDGGFVQLTGEVGTGKTTICRCLLEQVPENVDLALVLNPKVTAEELIATLCDELGIEHPGENSSIKTLTDLLNKYLLDAYARGRRTVLVIDEAQNLSADVLEQVRLLTNLETATRKLLQIILIGQPELRTLLARDDMRQLSQRITARYHLEPLSRGESVAYIKHRLGVCGSSRNIFSRKAVDAIHQLSDGVPRLINVLCDRAMLGAYVEGKTQVDKKVVRKASREVLEEQTDKEGRRWGALAIAGMLMVAVLAVMVYQPWQPAANRKLGQSVPAAPVIKQPATRQPEDIARVTSAVASDQVPAREDAVEVEQSLGPLLYEIGELDNREAWAELFGLWSVTTTGPLEQDYCEVASDYGLICLKERGTWNSLRKFDRPAILELVAADGSEVEVVLQHLDESVAGLIIAGELYNLTIEQVGRYWYGDYTLLLQSPPGGRMYLRSGDRAPDVTWLREQIEKIQGIKIPTNNSLVFDHYLQQKVVEFQGTYGLLQDGIVGKNTLIHINTEAGREGVPRLSVEPS